MMHQEVTKEWSEWGNDVDYGPFAFDGKENVAHPDVPSPLRDDFGAIDGSLGPLVNLEGRTFKDGKTYSLVDLCGMTGDTRKNEKGRPLDGHSLKPFLLDPKTEKWDGPDAALTALFRWAKTYNPSEQSYTLRSKDWRYIRYSNGKEELYDHVNDPYEWTNLAGNPEHGARLESFRKQLTQRLPAPSDIPVPQEADAEAWKDKFFKSHPDADTNQDGVLSWPEYKVYKAKLDAKKAKNKPQP